MKLLVNVMIAAGPITNLVIVRINRGTSSRSRPSGIPRGSVNAVAITQTRPRQRPSGMSTAAPPSKKRGKAAAPPPVVRKTLAPGKWEGPTEEPVVPEE